LGLFTSIGESYLKRSFSNENDIKSATNVPKGASDLAGVRNLSDSALGVTVIGSPIAMTAKLG
jgi:hypothetical protein